LIAAIERHYAIFRQLKADELTFRHFISRRRFGADIIIFIRLIVSLSAAFTPLSADAIFSPTLIFST
jgi:hypothetical protein